MTVYAQSDQKKIECDSVILTLPNFLRYFFCNLNSFKCVCIQAESEFYSVSYNKEKFKYIQYISQLICSFLNTCFHVWSTTYCYQMLNWISY